MEVSSAATQADGSYSLAGLFPGPYMLEVAAEGYETAWYESGTSFGTATQVDALAQQVTTGVDLAVAGAPASISGNVETGEAPGAVVVQVTAKPAWTGADPATEYVTATDGAGAYTFAGLPAPGTYELAFVAEGYQPTSLSERVLGGQSRFALDVTLGAGPGQIAGTVTDGSAPVGGVEVSTTMDGKPVVVGTPTVGQVGQFVVPNLHDARHLRPDVHQAGVQHADGRRRPRARRAARGPAGGAVRRGGDRHAAASSTRTVPGSVA